MGWKWATGTPRERADMVRSHVVPCMRNAETMKKLFDLTDDGLRAILDGADWKPEYVASAIAPNPPPR